MNTDQWAIRVIILTLGAAFLYSVWAGIDLIRHGQVAAGTTVIGLATTLSGSLTPSILSKAKAADGKPQPVEVMNTEANPAAVEEVGDPT